MSGPSVTEDADCYLVNDGRAVPLRIAKRGLSAETIGLIKGYAAGGLIEPGGAALDPSNDDDVRADIARRRALMPLDAAAAGAERLEMGQINDMARAAPPSGGFSLPFVSTASALEAPQQLSVAGLPTAAPGLSLEDTPTGHAVMGALGDASAFLSDFPGRLKDAALSPGHAAALAAKAVLPPGVAEVGALGLRGGLAAREGVSRALSGESAGRGAEGTYRDMNAPKSETAPLKVADLGGSSSSSSSASASSSRPMEATVQAPIPVDNDLEAGLQKIRSANEMEADLATQRAAREAEIAEARVRAMDEARAEFQAQRAENQARIDGMRADIMGAKIEPDRLFANMSTGQRVSAAIGLILGGIGQGLSGSGANAAQVALDKAVERDLESQRADLGNKKSLLSFYVDQGKDIETAYGLAKADALDIAAAKMQSLAAKLGGSQAAALAERSAGELLVKAAQLRDENLSRDIENKWTPRLNALKVQQANLAATEKAAAQTAAQSQGEVEAALYRGEAIPGEAIRYAPEWMQKEGVLVQAAPGLFVAAQSEPGAKKIRDASEASAVLGDLIQKMRAFRKEGRAWTPGERAAVASEYQRLSQLAIKEGAALGTWDKGSAELLGDLVSNPGNILTLDSTVFGRLDALDSWRKTREIATINENTYRPRQSTSVTERKAGQPAAGR